MERKFNYQIVLCEGNSNIPFVAFFGETTNSPKFLLDMVKRQLVSQVVDYKVHSFTYQPLNLEENEQKKKPTQK